MIKEGRLLFDGRRFDVDYGRRKVIEHHRGKEVASYPLPQGAGEERADRSWAHKYAPPLPPFPKSSVASPPPALSHVSVITPKTTTTAMNPSTVADRHPNEIEVVATVHEPPSPNSFPPEPFPPSSPPLTVKLFGGSNPILPPTLRKKPGKRKPSPRWADEAEGELQPSLKMARQRGRGRGRGRGAVAASRVKKSGGSRGGHHNAQPKHITLPPTSDTDFEMDCDVFVSTPESTASPKGGNGLRRRNKSKEE